MWAHGSPVGYLIPCYALLLAVSVQHQSYAEQMCCKEAQQQNDSVRSVPKLLLRHATGLEVPACQRPHNYVLRVVRDP